MTHYFIINQLLTVLFCWSIISTKQRPFILIVLCAGLISFQQELRAGKMNTSYNSACAMWNMFSKEDLMT